MILKIIWFSTVAILAVGILAYEAENKELEREARISHEIIKACEADRIRLLND